MTKKLFVVLVLVGAMLVTFSLVMGAKKGVRGPLEVYEKIEFMDQQTPILMPKGELTEQQTATKLYPERPNKETATYTASGTLAGQINIPGGKDFCDLYGNPAFYITDWFYGLEWYANYQDPQEHGCVSVFPFLVDMVGFDINVGAAISIEVQGFVLETDLTDPDCPVPGDVLCETPIYTVDIPSAGWWTIGLPMVDRCCMDDPYFAAIYIYTDFYGMPDRPDPVAEDDPDDICRSYNDYGYGWEDLVVIYGWPGEMILFSTGWTEPQNDCGCCQFDGYCCSCPLAYQQGCIDNGGTWFDGFVCIDDECQPYGEPEPEGCCQFPDHCADGMTEVACNNQGGVWFAFPPFVCIDDSCQPSCEGVSCEMQNDNGSAASYFGSWEIGDQNATYLDPADLCPHCTPVYPLRIEKVKGKFYDFAGAGQVDVIVHLYEVGAQLCYGPGAAFYSYGPVTVTDFHPNWAEIVLPEVLCVNGPFFLAIEYASGIPGEIPSILFDNNPPVDTCYQWNDYQGSGWIEWWNFWSTPADVGWLMIRAVGFCNCCSCPVACDLQQEDGVISSYFSGLSAGDVIAKYFDPEVYCDDPVYPYKIHDVDMVFYDFAGVGAVDIIIDVHIVCEDTCDGPGTRIYKSDPITVTTFYPEMAHIDLPEQVCVYEPFFISIEWATGAPGSTPSFLMEPDYLPCDSCHAWMYYPTGGADYWIEWYDFWSPPTPGCPILRVTGFTKHPDCQEEPCDTTLDTLSGSSAAAYFWTIPDPYGDDFFNERFDMPAANGGRLDAFYIAFYGTESSGTPDPDFYVWLSDGVYPLDNNPPHQAIADFHILYPPVWYPGWNTIQTWDRGIHFDPGESFHIGYSHADHVNDVLACLSCGDVGSSRSTEWWGVWGTMLDDWGVGVDFLINAVICPEAPIGSTFTVACSPFQAFATPGDPPEVKFHVDVGSVLGYDLIVDLSCTPPGGINVSFAPNPVTPPDTSDVTISVDDTVTYGAYTLTFCGLGADGQGPKCCDVTLRVQAPYDECEVEFNQGKYYGMQRGSNFGAVGNDSRDNFVYYGTNYLFDGSFVIATTDMDHMALDIYNCEHWDWMPSKHAEEYVLDKYNANVCEGHFYSEANIPGECDSVFIVGIMDSCVDFSIKIKIYYNEGPDPIEGMYLSLFEDWDIGDAYNNFGDMDPAHNLVWMFDPNEDNLIFGAMKAPYYDDPLYNMYLVRNHQYVWPCAGFCDWSDTDPEFYCLDSLYYYMTLPGYFPAAQPDTDMSILMTAGPIDLEPGEKHIEVWIDFARDLNDGLTWSQWWHKVLRYAGFYRGDVNASDTLELPALDVSDLVYLIQYLFQNGPEPLPYLDQGDVNADRVVNIGDVVYLINHVFHGHKCGPPPVDYIRFIPQMWSRESLFENHNWD